MHVPVTAQRSSLAQELWPDAFRARAELGKQTQLEFSGNGRDYFSIWIRNVLLTAVTLGLYSPWAKVRRLQYFYRGTTLNGASFDYDADPRSLLQGRLLLVVFLAAASLLRSFGEWPQRFVLIASALIFPWAYWQAMRFRAYHTTHRGIRFGSQRTLASAYGALLLPMLLVLAGGEIWNRVLITHAAQLGTLVPIVSLTLTFIALGFLQFASKRFTWGGLCYGVTPFESSLSAFDIVISWVVAVLIYFTAGLLLFLFPKLGALVSSPAVMFGCLGLLWLGVRSFLEAQSRWYITHSLELANIRFASTMSAGAMFALQAKVWLLLIVSGGLYWPWAAVRLWKFRVESLALEGSTPFSSFCSTTNDTGSAFGECLASSLDFDLGV